MHDISYFKQRSSIHDVVNENQGFSIQPHGATEAQLASFQVIAREALQYAGSDYHVKAAPAKPPYEVVYFMPKINLE